MFKKPESLVIFFGVFGLFCSLFLIKLPLLEQEEEFVYFSEEKRDGEIRKTKPFPKNNLSQKENFQSQIEEYDPQRQKQLKKKALVLFFSLLLVLIGIFVPDLRNRITQKSNKKETALPPFPL